MKNNEKESEIWKRIQTMASSNDPGTKPAASGTSDVWQSIDKIYKECQYD